MLKKKKSKQKDHNLSITIVPVVSNIFLSIYQISVKQKDMTNE